MDGKIEQRVSIMFCVKLGKTATETLKVGERLLNGIHISRPVACQLKMNVQGDQAPAKQQKNIEKNL
jgi:hypothetical protein